MANSFKEGLFLRPAISSQIEDKKKTKQKNWAVFFFNQSLQDLVICEKYHLKSYQVDENGYLHFYITPVTTASLMLRRGNIICFSLDFQSKVMSEKVQLPL